MWRNLFQANTVHEKGAIAVIFYPDPADFTSAEDPLVYPDSWWLPPTAAVSGSLFTGDGDPLTPGYPALSK